MYRICRLGMLSLVGLGFVLGSVGCSAPGLLITPVSTNRQLAENSMGREGYFARDKIVVIDVSGILMNSHSPGFFSDGEHPVSLFQEKLDKAASDSNVKAVVLRINSPGGSVTASDMMYHELLRFREKTKKPVITVMMDVAASGGYYIACATDTIVAHPTTVTGSIGVIMQMFDLTETMRKLGVSTDAITSGPRKDSGSPLRTMRPDERSLFQSMVDEFYERFVQVVDAGRPNLDTETVRKLADGRVYTGQEAVRVGLADRLGTLRDGIALAKEKANLSKVHVVRYDRPLAYRPNIYAQSPAPAATQINLLNIHMANWFDPAPQFMYLWQPSLAP